MSQAELTPSQLSELRALRSRHAKWAGGLGSVTVFLPLSDVVAVGGIWTSLLIKTARVCGHEVDGTYAKKFAIAIARGTLLYVAGSRLGTALVAWTGLGTPAAMAANAALNFGYTWLLGGFLSEQFKSKEIDWGGLGKAAAAYLISFGISEVSGIREGQEVASAVENVQDVVDDHASLGLQHGFGDSYVAPPQAPLSGPLKFSGLEHTELIAGDQGNQPWCGVHAVGNLVQMANPGVGEEINQHILTVAQQVGGLREVSSGLALDIAHFQPLLEQVYRLPCHWDVFSVDHAAQLLQSNHGVLVGGDLHELNPDFPPRSWHALNLTDYKVDAQGQAWFKGLDSQQRNREVWWAADRMTRFLDRARECFGRNFLVTDQPVPWPYRSA